MQPNEVVRPRLGRDAVSLGDHLIRVVKLLNAHRHQVPRQHPGVDPAAYPLLFTLAVGSMRMSELAAHIHSDISTVSRQVAHFVALGLMTRDPDPTDGRAQQLHLTDEALALLVSVQASRERWVDHVLADWTQDDRAAFAAHLARFASSLEQHLPSRDHAISKDDL